MTLTGKNAATPPQPGISSLFLTLGIHSGCLSTLPLSKTPDRVRRQGE